MALGPEQPVKLHSPLTLQCCYLMHNHLDLQMCVDNTSYVNNFLRKAADSTSQISIYTYVSDNIVQYSAYSTAINMAYAEHNRYDYHIIGRNRSTDPYKNSPDHRWNKVHIILEALKMESDTTTSSSSFKDFLDNTEEVNDESEYREENEGVTIVTERYIVWLDADLIIMDMGLRIEEIAREYPEADLIMSRDTAKAEFVSNSGFMIVRKSPWSVDFFTKWWTSYDRARCCDQNAFTWLYDKFDQANLTHVKLLRPDTINSNFPAFLNQAPKNPVLHLAGSSDLYRTPVFLHGMQDLCRAGWDQNYPSTLFGRITRGIKYIHAVAKFGKKFVDHLYEQRATISPQLGLNTAVLTTYIIRLSHDRLEKLAMMNEQVKATPCLRQGIWDVASEVTEEEIIYADELWVQDHFTKISVDSSTGEVLEDENPRDMETEEEHTLIPPYYVGKADMGSLEKLIQRSLGRERICRHGLMTL